MISPMRFCGRLLATIALLLCFTGTSATFARELTEAETAKLVQQVAGLREAYPEYEGVAFANATMELFKE